MIGRRRLRKLDFEVAHADEYYAYRVQAIALDSIVACAYPRSLPSIRLPTFDRPRSFSPNTAARVIGKRAQKRVLRRRRERVARRARTCIVCVDRANDWSSGAYPTAFVHRCRHCHTPTSIAREANPRRDTAACAICKTPQSHVTSPHSSRSFPPGQPPSLGSQEPILGAP